MAYVVFEYLTNIECMLPHLCEVGECYIQFMGEETEAWRAYVNYLKLLSKSETLQVFNIGSL